MGTLVAIDEAVKEERKGTSNDDPDCSYSTRILPRMRTGMTYRVRVRMGPAGEMKRSPLLLYEILSDG